MYEWTDEDKTTVEAWDGQGKVHMDLSPHYERSVQISLTKEAARDLGIYLLQMSAPHRTAY